MAKTKQPAKSKVAGALTAPRKQATTLQKIIESSAKELGRALPKGMEPERIVRIALTLIRLNPKLAECTQESFLGALFVSAQLGIEPIAGLGYLIPFNRKFRDADGWHTVKEVQFVLGYKGVVDLFYRHEKTKALSWGVVKNGDEFEYEQGTNAFLRHKPSLSREEAIAYWVMADLAGGVKVFHVMNRAECLEHGVEHSKTYDKKNDAFYPGSPWLTSEDSMCLKTCLTQGAKIWPTSTKLKKALEQDETSRNFRPGIDPIDVPAEKWDPEEDPKEESSDSSADIEGEGQEG